MTHLGQSAGAPSEPASKRAALGGDREGERERGACGRSRPVRERAPGKGCRSGRQNRDTGSGAASLSAPVQLELHGLRDGRRLPSPSQVSEPLRNSGGASATGSLFSAPFLKGGNRSFSKRAVFLFDFFIALLEIGDPRRGKRDSPGSPSFFNFPFLIGPAVPAELGLRAGAGERAQGRDGGTRRLLSGRDWVDSRSRGARRAGKKCSARRSGAAVAGSRRLLSAPAAVGEKPGSRD